MTKRERTRELWIFWYWLTLRMAFITGWVLLFACIFTDVVILGFLSAIVFTSWVWMVAEM